MGKTLNGEQLARDERDGFIVPDRSRPSLGRRIGCVLSGLSFLLLLLGCAANDSASDDNRRGGFYGGVSGGMSHP